jgi:2-oxoglutarate ferredoxin oxidoreductase subunit delta
MVQRVREKKRIASSITINKNWCKPCGICVEFCPRGVLGKGLLGEPMVANPDNCNVCRNCEIHCPEIAIIVTEGGS